MKIIYRYVLKEHVGPFLFALSALTSLLLLQLIARRFGDLVGRGLSWQTIAEFFILSLPYTIEETLPMAVLVAVLYAFSRLASENEITALKAGGISARALLRPALGAGLALTLTMVWFNDQVESRTNHELATLQAAIFRTKPTFALKEQIINPIKEGQLYLRAGQIAQDQSGHMRDVTIYDVSDPTRRRTIFADSGTLVFATNHRDLLLHLYHGMVMSAPLAQPGQLDRIYYHQDVLKVRDVANSFQSIDADTASKSEREMNICEMQTALEQRNAALHVAYDDSVIAAWRIAKAHGKAAGPQPQRTKPKKGGGAGALYCTFITKYLHIAVAEAADLPPSMRVAEQAAWQDTSTKKVPAGDSVVVVPDNTIRKGMRSSPAPATSVTAHPALQNPPADRPRLGPRPPGAAAAKRPASAIAVTTDVGTAMVDLGDATIRLADARHWRERYQVEIQKKFSLAAACIVFVVVGAPIALRFPRGGVGFVMGVGLFVFAVYYICLLGGEALADNGIISPFWAEWADNLIFLVIGLLFITRMGNEGVTGRGGSFGEVTDSVRAWFARRRGSRSTGPGGGV